MKRALLLTGALAGIAGVALMSRRQPLDLTGRVVLITGGSRGLGLELAREFTATGARVALLARDRAELERAAGQLQGVPLLLECDLRDAGRVDSSVDEVIRELGRLDVLVNCAGTIRVGPIENLGRDDFHEDMGNNFFGALHATLAALPHLESSGSGRIVNITSIGGRIPVPHLTPYTASKFALVGLSEALGAELARSGVQVTTVTPGLMRTGSPYRALFGGRSEQEFRWFLLLSSLPGLSIGSRRAARQIVAACRHGQRSLIIPAYLRLPIVAHAVAPGLFGAAVGLVGRLLPGPAPSHPERLKEGREVLPPHRSPSYAILTKRAAKRNNELGTPEPQVG